MNIGTTTQNIQALTNLVEDLELFGYDSVGFIRIYYPSTGLQTNLAVSIIEERSLSQNVSPSCQKVKECFIAYLKKKIEQESLVLKEASDPWISKYRLSADKKAALDCFKASTHIEDILFAATVVAEQQYDRGVEPVLGDLEYWGETYPTYPQVLEESKND